MVWDHEQDQGGSREGFFRQVVKRCSVVEELLDGGFGGSEPQAGKLIVVAVGTLELDQRLDQILAEEATEAAAAVGECVGG